MPLAELTNLRKLTYDGDDIALSYALKHLEALPASNAERVIQIGFLVDKPLKALWGPLNDILTQDKSRYWCRVEVWDRSDFNHLPKLNARGILHVYRAP